MWYISKTAPKTLNATKYTNKDKIMKGALAKHRQLFFIIINEFFLKLG
jgi:hypothetical protein